MEYKGFRLLKLPENMTDAIRIKKIRSGLNPDDVARFFKSTGRPMSDWKSVLPFSPRTFERKISHTKKQLKPEPLRGESAEAILETAEIYHIGQMAFDDRLDRLNEWLTTENPYLEEQTPLSLLDTHHGREMVKNELSRIEHGIFG
ncbi:MAG TPA: DUF2384 domain-containing protein [Spirochaetota bacterium]|nr:DUF2384 domain-containing protein [Spirochaetota bacterium]